MELTVWPELIASQAALLAALGGLVVTSLAIVRDIDKRRAQVITGVVPTRP